MKTETLKPEEIQRWFPGASKSLLAANGRAVAAEPVVSPLDAVKPRRATEPNKTEREFERILRAKFPTCEIRWEAYVFRMASRLTYSPDFSVFDPATNELTFYEVKGSYIWPNALKSPRMAAQEFPHRFFLAQKSKGEWKITEFEKRHT